MSAKSSIQVCIKVRPCEAGDSSVWEVKEGRSIHLIDSQADPCVFDYVFDQTAHNQEVFDRMAKHIVHACMQGFNGTIFAYGQTSSGKTYTMMGDNQNLGVMVLAAKEIFKQIANENDRDFLLRVGYIEIYNEKIYDLLNKKNQDLKIHEAGNGIVNVNCEECIITSESDLLRFLCMGNKERTVGETNMNERSSRSHAIFRIIIESRKSDRTDDDAVIQSVLNLVDLAGSERADQTGARGARLKEGGHINKSLLFLSNVIKNLSENVDNKYISFRDSKLTRILQASLGGNAFTSIICTIKPSIIEESQSTINFAMRAKKIRIKPEVNEMVSDATMMKRLEREIKELKDRLAEEQRKNESQLKVKQLENRIQNDMHKIITSNSLNDKRLQKRRRTWCPATSIPEGGLPTPLSCIPAEPSQERQSKVSQLPKPVFFPNSHISHRADNGPKTVNIMKSLDIGTDEEFAPAELIDFGCGPSDALRTREQSRVLPALALTPNIGQMGVASLVEKTKNDRLELQMFTSLEKHFEGDWENSQALTAKLSEVTAQRDELESESQKNAQRCDALQAELQAANAKNLEYEEQLKTMKETMQKLELDNREAVSLEFEYQSHKTKSKLRETDLLSALSEKDLTIENLQKSLDELSRDVLRNSKEEQMRSPIVDTSLPETICDKCVEFERLLADVNAKLESVQLSFSQKTEDCERLNILISTAHDDMAVLQGKYDGLELNWQSQQQAIQAMEADCNELQQKFQKLQQEYEDLGRTSKANKDQCLQLEAENTALQAEIVTLKERVEEAQRLLLETSNEKAFAEQLKAQNEELKKELSEVQSSFQEMQREYDCLSNELMESVEECDSLRSECNALREELKQRSMPSYDIESMKSSGVGTECSEADLESETDSGFLEKFAKLSDSLHEIELQHRSGCSRLFRATKIQEHNVPGLKLCLESATDIHTVAHTLNDDAADSVCLKGVLRQHRFQIIRLTQESAPAQEDAEKRRLLDHIAQLENEIAQKNMLIDATEGNINEMREQMTNLESALLEKSVIVNKVESYQRQIESLEKQNAEITIVCEELQEKVKENTMSESLMLSPGDDTLPGNTSTPLMLQDQESAEIAALKASLSELMDKVAELQGKVENQLSQMQQKDNHIDVLRAEIEELNERCISMEVKQVELQSNASQQQQLLERQAEKLSDDVRRIDQLQETNAKLVERSIKAEDSLTVMQERLLHDNRIESLEESLKSARDRVETLEEELKSGRDCIEAREEDLKSAGYRIHTLEEDLKIARDRVEALEDELKSGREGKETLEKELKSAGDRVEKLEEELKSAKDRIEASEEDLKSARDRIVTLEESIKSARDHIETLERDLHSARDVIDANEKQKTDELNALKLEYLDKIEQSENEYRSNFRKYNAEWEEGKERYEQSVSRLMADQAKAAAQHQAELEDIRTEQNAVLEQLKQEKLELESLYAKSQELVAKLQLQLNARDRSSTELLDDMTATAQQRIQELEERCEKHILDYEQLRSKFQSDLEKLTEEKVALHSEMKDVEAQHTITLEKIHLLEQHLETLSKQTCSEKAELLDKIETFTLKNSDLSAELKRVQKKARDFDDLFSQHQQLQACLSEATGVNISLREQVESLQCELNSAQEKQSKQNVEIEELRSKLKGALEAQTFASTQETVLKNQLQEMEAKMIAESVVFKREVEGLRGARNELELKLNSLKESKAKLESSNKDLEVTMKNAKNLQSLLQEEQELCSNLRDVSEKLEESNAQLVAQLKEKDAACASLQDSVSQQKLALEEANKKCSEVQQAQQSVEELKNECEMLRTTLQTKEEQICTLTKKAESNSELEDQLKLRETERNSLRVALVQQEKLLEEMSQQADEARKSVAEQTNECKRLQMALSTLESERDSLRNTVAQQDQTNAETKKQLMEMQQKDENSQKSVTALNKECDRLRTTMKKTETNYRTERERLNATVSSLLEDKRNLEEKLCTLNEIMEKLQADLTALQGLKANASNASFESNASSTSPASTDRLAVPRKSISFESDMRKNRRLSVHDDRRRQSYWNNVRDWGTMTDPVDNNCNCVELNRKLQECQRDLFIRESQVTALNIELKNHPLKEENAQLRKRLLEDQEKARAEVKRLKMKNQDLTSRINDLTAAAAASESLQAAQGQACRITPAMTSVDTQTESDLETVLEKINQKYQDSLKLCRFRYSLIQDLEQRLKQNENTDTSNMTSLTAGQINALKTQCESQKKELSAMNEKYEYAKRVLKMRKDEVVEMRNKIAAYEAASSAK
ncbi:kinesin-like protein KIN-7I isoform X2 [Drosophila subobscura]|uniref:kinesin-like protein KIN-7I isoform X2 n=1 Tax=Drosophila subobscura TaxID=7241 RepID=UPI00155A0F03|nr:kinesin-like protein KIN-7I isoform X2 [Drosophila subobscura]